MNKTYQFRIYPTKKQEIVLNEWLALCCEVYNAALQERRDAYRMSGVSIGFAHQSAELPGCKEIRPELAELNSQVVQEAVKRVDLAFAAFFRRCEVGEKPGYPRFRSRFRYDSLTFKQYNNSFSFESLGKRKGKLFLSKIGHLKMVMHRPIQGTPKTAIVRRMPTGKWFVSITCMEVEPIRMPPSEEQVGIDVGLKTFAYLSTGEPIDNPRFFREEERALAKAQRRRDKEARGTRERRKRAEVVARVYERVRSRRQNFIQQQVALLVKRFGLIAVEALVVRNLVKNPRLAKSIADVAWSAFFAHLLCKAEEAGREVVRVNPAYTSQICSCCGHRQEMPLSVRIYECPNCGSVLDRDYNSSVNILAKACGRAGRVIVRRCASMALTGVSSVTRAKVTKAPPDFRPERDEGTVAWWEKATEGKCPFPRRLSARPYMVRPQGRTLGEPGLSATPLAGTLLRETQDYQLRSGELINALPVGARRERGNHPREDLRTEQDHGGTTGSPNSNT